MNRAGIPRPKIRAIAIVWQAGRPVIEDAWVKGLLPEEREIVDHALRMRGYRINGFAIEELDNGDHQHCGA